jgi:hypothetical protein
LRGRKAEDEANRASYLDQLGNREEATRNQIAAHIQKRQPDEYEKAMTPLIDCEMSRYGKGD